MMTIRDVAERAGVSVATVSHVINGTRKVASETAERVQRAMEELDYQPNAVAQSLRTRVTHAIGVVVSDITNPFFATLVRGAEDAAREHGYSLLICNTSETLENERIYLRLLAQRRVDGLLLAPTGKNDELIHRLLRHGMHVVVIDRKLENVSAPGVFSENEEGAYKATAYLLEQGHRRIGIILGLPDVSAINERFQGYQRALADHGLEEGPGLIAYGRSQVAGGKEACLALLRQESPPTAVFATNNLMTVGVMLAIRELGLSCPEDVSVVGFDDFDWMEIFDPPLTTVTQQPYRIGYEGVELLLGGVNGCPSLSPAQEIRIGVELRIRGSVASPSAGRVGEAECSLI
jgi:LacI family transcriptional regulator